MSSFLTLPHPTRESWSSPLGMDSDFWIILLAASSHSLLANSDIYAVFVPSYSGGTARDSHPLLSA